jgi:hypothetical protein
VKAFVAQVVLNVGNLASEEVINDKDFVTIGQQPVYQMRTDVARSTSDQYLHFLPFGLTLRLSKQRITLSLQEPSGQSFRVL